ncbi:MAG: hypothetical protein LBI61_00260 [Puniceicoccales bacterium]|jgi:hypothetical protein|nr:hypothetical protein [Puniceicoccales bacterium]
MNCAKVINFITSSVATTAAGASPKTLFNGDGTLTLGNTEVCKILCVEREIKDATQFNDFFQKNLLRPKNAELGEKFEPKVKLTDRQCVEVPGAYKSLGMLSEVLPKFASHDHIVIFGTGTSLMDSSYAFAKNRLSEVIEKNPAMEIFFLTVSRPLSKNADSDDTQEKLLPNFNPKSGRMLAVSVNQLTSFQRSVIASQLARNRWFAEGGTLEDRRFVHRRRQILQGTWRAADHKHSPGQHRALCLQRGCAAGPCEERK